VTQAAPSLRATADLCNTSSQIGLAFGPILGAPLSETLGRSIVYKVTAPVFILFLAGSGQAQTFGTLCTCRLLAGIVGGPVLAVGAGSVADMVRTMKVPKYRLSIGPLLNFASTPLSTEQSHHPWS